MSDFVTTHEHEDGHIHRIGKQLLIPTHVTTGGVGIAASNGDSEIAARDNHQHGDSGAVGEVRLYAPNTAPTGWQLANGAAISRTTYAVLFGLIGTTYGVGDSSTTFNIPTVAAAGGVNYYIKVAPTVVN